MIFYNNGLKRGWYHHQVAGKCDNCDQGFNEGELVLNADTLQELCYNCYNIVAFPTEQNKKWINTELRGYYHNFYGKDYKEVSK
jgi:hypothetical protein